MCWVSRETAEAYRDRRTKLCRPQVERPKGFLIGPKRFKRHEHEEKTSLLKFINQLQVRIKAKPMHEKC
jgi:hypothetical protein